MRLSVNLPITIDFVLMNWLEYIFNVTLVIYNSFFYWTHFYNYLRSPSSLLPRVNRNIPLCICHSPTHRYCAYNHKLSVYHHWQCSDSSGHGIGIGRRLIDLKFHNRPWTLICHWWRTSTYWGYLDHVDASWKNIYHNRNTKASGHRNVKGLFANL